MRDGLRINTEEGFLAIGDTPREQRLRQSSAKRALKTGFMNLPKPENNFELLVPEDEEDELPDRPLAEEDAAERDARRKRQREEEERKALARRSQVVQRNLPRPASVDMARLMAALTVDDDGSDAGAAAQLVHMEIVDLVHHDTIVHPIPGTVHPGGTRSAYQIPPDQLLA